ncbi:hypothetical protein GUITHDRAFT_153763 [Guillardia theta CCMP2712]|uniref:Uncharacterized protein n=1 Tax=Guillardia theta (strain CCMP2712) TaxID=905079 RepID=L1IKC4_GUITC|nr:hypothetical protein GUITHDRAFT_155165 [Guillardia theta CCMP2712]XP_005828806.1 hypothetical protein GUITHDRAFT_153763 [Guillardia theta CCMP2712]EKX36698.1 hypothetical protein GUITHDRAFT_155165 [Guillardia theta CCMP2712]EKX41826.1 hypothetical protein GUITHDRAFT_153763 [Guillardia theta CCMP2712]|eukprot:XP_005823678.1 hypothetical protein GUITHDRAFT_155165 [Guillardia theta CCMP2712]
MDAAMINALYEDVEYFLLELGQYFRSYLKPLFPVPWAMSGGFKSKSCPSCTTCESG